MQYVISISKEFNKILQIYQFCKSNEQLKLSVSSRLLFQEFPEIKLKLWKGHLWSTYYCLLTTGQTTLEVLKRYVGSQWKNKKSVRLKTDKQDNSCKIYGW